ncbi:M28 family metallopeptidase [Calditrichota bacterium LG25]
MAIFRIFLLYSLFFIELFGQNYCNVSLYQNLYDHISYLASDELKGRFPLTKGDFLAREYITSVFKEIGLIEIADNNYQQKFDFLHKIEPHCQFQIKTNTLTIALHRGTDFTISPESGNSKLINKKAVLLGYGNKIDSLKIKKLVKGKIVLAYLFPPKSIDKKIRKNYNWRNLIRQLERYDAKAILFIAPRNKYEKLKLLEEKYPYSQRIKKFKIPLIHISRNIYQRILTFNNLEIEKVEKEIEKNKGTYWKFLTNTNINLFVNLKFIYHKTSNLIGTLKGTSLKNNEFILIGAHYDHLLPKKVKGLQDSIRNGADDNASGVALLLEIARNLSLIKQRRFNFLFVCFGAEENGMIGAKFFIKYPIIRLKNIKLMINLDMVGRMEQNKLYINSYYINNEHIKLLSELSFKNELKLLVNQLGGGTDADVFRHINIPTIWISSGYHKDQHKVSDEIEKINFNGMIKIYNLLFQYIRSINSL